MREIFSSRPYLGEDPNGIYRLLKHTKVQQIVDVGAAAGGTVKLAKQSAPGAKVIAFEPFPGNFAMFNKETDGLSDVTLHRCAVSATPGVRKLAVAKQVSGSEPGWEGKVGYSSGSRLAADENSKNTIEINAVKLDDTVQGPISFLKIDVQGTERDVLESARKKFNRKEVDLCFVEFNGEIEIYDFFDEFKFYVFYTPILIAGGRLIPYDDTDFSVVVRKNMSNGNVGQCIWDRRAPGGIAQFSARIAELKVMFQCAVQTDLICVAPHFMSNFLSASSIYYSEMAS